ncbi:MAG: DNA-directed RNA polymerase subunit omega [Actinomycetes bacterium]
MADRRDTLMEPHLEALLDQEPSKFTLVTLAAMRAREINDYYGQLGEGLGKIVPPQVTSVSRKPLSIAMEEIREGKIIRCDLPEPVAEDEAVEADEAGETPAPDAG